MAIGNALGNQIVGTIEQAKINRDKKQAEIDAFVAETRKEADDIMAGIYGVLNKSKEQMAYDMNELSKEQGPFGSSGGQTGSKKQGATDLDTKTGNRSAAPGVYIDPTMAKLDRMGVRFVDSGDGMIGSPERMQAHKTATGAKAKVGKRGGLKAGNPLWFAVEEAWDSWLDGVRALGIDPDAPAKKVVGAVSGTADKAEWAFSYEWENLWRDKDTAVRSLALSYNEALAYKADGEYDSYNEIIEGLSEYKFFNEDLAVARELGLIENPSTEFPAEDYNGIFTTYFPVTGEDISFAFPGFEAFDFGLLDSPGGFVGELQLPWQTTSLDQSGLIDKSPYLSESNGPRGYDDFVKWEPGRTPDPGVPELVNIIEQNFPGMVQHVEIPIHKIQSEGWQGPPQNLTDLDVLLKNGVVIQVKTGKGKNLVSQLQDSTEITGVKAIGFDANEFANTGKPDITWVQRSNVQKAGFEMTKNVDELLDLIRKTIK